MKILDVEYRDVYFVLDASKKNLEYLKKILDHANIKYDGESEPEMVDAVKYMNETLYPLLEKIEKAPNKPDEGS